MHVKSLVISLKANVLAKKTSSSALRNIKRQNWSIITFPRYLQSVRRCSTCHKTDTDAATDSTDYGDYEIILPSNPPIWGNSHIELRTVPKNITRPPYALKDWSTHDAEEGWVEPYDGDGRILLNSPDESHLRKSAVLSKEVLSYAGKLVKIGITTDEIDEKLHAFIISRSAYPSPLLYSGYPRSCCTSVNNIVVHGIPDSRPLKDGDIVNIDITVYKDGYHGDTSKTFLVGAVDEQGRDLVNATEEALEAGIQACGPGKPFKDIGRAIFNVASTRGFSISSQFTGHGIGSAFHRPPWIVHDRNDEPGIMLPGHCFTIEPCLVQGSQPRAWIFPDGWTASTENGARSAQAEHMVLITETGVDVLTR